MSDKDWKKAGIEEEDEPESAEKKELAEPSSVEELGTFLLLSEESEVRVDDILVTSRNSMKFWKLDENQGLGFKEVDV